MSASGWTSNPYPGPRPFEPDEQPLFFGRDVETADITSLIIAHRVLLIYAQSGAGKTSLLNAGLIPSLVEQGFSVLPPARVRGLLPQDLDPAAIPNVYALNTLLGWRGAEADYRPYLSLSLSEFLSRRERPTDDEGFARPSVMVFDQFEELFAFYPERWTDRAEFFRQVAEALQADPLLRAVFVMREDYLASLDPFAHLLPGQLVTRYRLERLRPHAACAAVEGPLRGTGRTFAPDVASSLVDQLLAIRVEHTSGRTVEVPGEFIEAVQLQVACQSLWSDLPPDVTTITHEHVRTFGDVHQALREFYEDTLSAASQESGVAEDDLRTWFDRHLITPSGTRGTVFRGPEKTAGIPNAAVDVLEDRHLIRAELRAGARWYELTHDRFITPIQASNESWRQHVGVTRLRGQMRSRFVWSVGTIAVVALAAVMLNFMISYWRMQSHELAAKALLTLSIDPEEALRLAVRAAETAPGRTNDAVIENALRQALREFRVRTMLAGHTAPVLTAVFSPDARFIVTASQDNSARIWDASTGNSQELNGHAEDVVSAQFSPDGASVLTGSVDETARIWDTVTGETLRELRGHTGAITSAVFSPDGKSILTASLDGTARIWDTATGQTLQELPWHGEPIVHATFSRDGTLAGLVSWDGTVRLWEVTTGRSRVELRSDAGSLTTMAFSPDGTLVVTASDDSTARIWNVNSGANVLTLHGHTDRLTDALFSPDGRLVLTTSDDRTVRVWDASSGSTLSELRGHQARVASAVFSADGARILSASDDGTARIWHARRGALLATLRGHHLSVTTAEFSPDRRRALTSSADGTARIWDVTGGETASFSEQSAGITSIFFSRDGSRVVSGDYDGTVLISDPGSGGSVRQFTDAIVAADGRWVVTSRETAGVQVWDAATGTLRAQLEDPLARASSLFTSDGQRVPLAGSEQRVAIAGASAGSGQLVSIWDLRTPSAPEELAHGEWIERIALSPGGAMLLVAGGTTARVHDLDSGSEALLQTFTGNITDAAFSSDGRRIVITSGDQTARVWDTRTGEQVASLEGHRGWVTSAVFSPRGSRVATGSADQTARVWNLDDGRVAELRGHSDAVIGVAFNPSARASNSEATEFVVTAAADGSVRIWAVGQTDAAVVMEWRGAAGWIAAAFSPEARRVATGDQDGVVRIHECESCQSTHELLALARSRLHGAVNHEGEEF